MKLDFNNVKGKALGYLASAAIRAFVNKSPDNRKKVKVTDFDLEVYLNGEPIDMEVFSAILDTESRLLGGKSQMELAKSEMESTRVRLVKLNPMSVAQSVVEKIVEDLGGPDSKLAALVDVPDMSADYDNYESVSNGLQSAISRIAYIDV